MYEEHKIIHIHPEVKKTRKRSIWDRLSYELAWEVPYLHISLLNLLGLAFTLFAVAVLVYVSIGMKSSAAFLEQSRKELEAIEFRAEARGASFSQHWSESEVPAVPVKPENVEVEAVPGPDPIALAEEQAAVEETTPTGFHVVNATLDPMIESLSPDLQLYCWNKVVEQGWDTNLMYPYVIATLYHESGFNPKAHSATDDYGIAQINGAYIGHYAKQLGLPVDTVKWDAKASIDAMMLVIQDNLNYIATYAPDQLTNIKLIGMSYNSGIGGARKNYNRGIWTTYATELADEYSQFCEIING